MKKVLLLSLLVLLISVNVYASGNKSGSPNGKKYVPGRVLIKLKAKPGVFSGENLRKSASTQSIMQKIGAVTQQAVFSEKYSTTTQQRIANEIGLDRWVAVTVPVVADMEKLLAQLRQDPNVEIAEPDYIEKIDVVPNDPLYSSQQHLPQIKAAQAWDIQQGDTTIVIAIIDTGVDWDHPDLASVIWSNPSPGPSNDVRGWDFVDLTGIVVPDADPNDDLYTQDNNPMDYQGHGTHVAGIAGAATNNSTGVASISWGCKIMPLRIGFRTTDGSGSGYSSWMALAFQYAADNGASAANLSFSNSGTAIIDAALYAFRNGVVICNSAGNGNNETPSALGQQPWVLKVAGLNDIDQKASYSSYGTWVNISSPGGDSQTGGGYYILSTIVNPSPFYGSQLYVAYPFEGTSMASPLVAGLAGLVKSRFPTMTPPDIVFQICATADNIDAVNPSYAGKLGYGRINAEAAVTSVAPALKPVLSFSSVILSDSIGGNNNGKAEPGETVEMSVFFKNEWENATNTSAILSTTDWGISITKASANYGTIPGIRDIDNSVKGNTSDKFTFTVSSDSIPRNVTFTISVTADQGYTKDFNLTISILPGFLFVDDDDGTSNVEQYYSNTFSNLGLVYNSWDRSAQGPLSAGQLTAYQTVVWGCEWAFPSLNSDDRTAIGGFLGSGGQLFISGQDIGWDMCDPGGDEYIASSGVSKTWYENYFKTQYQADNAGTTTINGVAGDPIGDGLSLSFTEPLAPAYPEVIVPLSGAQSVFRYPNSSTGATRYESTYKVVYFGFGGFEAITSSELRDTVMSRVFNWLNGYQLQHTPLGDTESPDSQLVQVKVASASNIESVNLYWDTDGSFPFNKLPMNSVGGGYYEAYIPGQTSATVQYTIIVRTATGYMPYNLFSYYAGVDNTPPVFISADSIWNTLSTAGVFSASARAQDNTMIDTNATYVVFQVNNSSPDSTLLQFFAPDSFSGSFDVHSLVSQLYPNDTVQYYYTIRDASSMHNYARWPSSGYYSIKIGRQFIDNFEKVRSIWDLGLSWGYETSLRGGITTNKAMSDSPTGNYLPNTENALTLIQPFDLSAYTTAKMYFYRLMQINTSDTLYIEYRQGAGGWNIIRQMNGGGIPSWKKDSVDIPGSSSATTLRFRLKSDGSNESNGILFDDIDIVGGTVVGITENEPAIIPNIFALHQNYPNPFNPVTNISFSVGTYGYTSLRIYDMLGREVAVLLNEEKPAGSYDVQWNAEGMASGMYFYQLKAGDFVSTRKMLLLK